MKARFSVEVDVPLDGDVDLALISASIPAATTVKGMFLSRYVKAIDEPWEEIVDDLELIAPPKGGRYTAFEDYPMVDYLRLLDRAARNRFPRSSTREAYRLLGRGDVEVFADSTLGKVTFSMIKDPAGALERYPQIISTLTRGAVTGEAVRGASEVKLVFAPFVGALEATLGCLEALVMTFDKKPRSDVTTDGSRAEFVVSWT